MRQPRPSRPARLVGAACLSAGALLAAAATPALAGTAPAAGVDAADPGVLTSAPVTTAPAPSDPAGPVMLGVVGGTAPMGSSRLTAFQSQVGRTMATVRVYTSWDATTWPDALSTYAKDNRQTVVLSVKTKTTSGQPVSWRGIADSRPGDAYDQQIVRWATTVKSFGAPVMFSLNHEPEVWKSDAMGGPADYVAAWRHVVQVFREQKVKNVEWVFIGTAFGFGQPGERATQPFYPGDAWVDDIAADGYNWADCRPSARIPWADPATLFGPFHKFLLQHPSKGALIGEFGTVEDPADPGRKAQWFRDLATMVEQPGWGQVRGMAEYYSTDPQDGCNWRIDTSASALSAFQSLAADPQLGARAVAPATVRQVVVDRTAGSPRKATVSWAAAGQGGSPVTSYTVTVAQTGQSYAVGGYTTAFTWTAPRSGSFTFRVTATNAAGTDRASDPVSVSLG